jgi:5-(carboxyamino)imidazole ribonucleotide synthase
MLLTRQFLLLLVLFWRLLMMFLSTAQLADGCDVITFENEFVDLDGLRPLERQGVLFQPSLSSLSPLLDKYVQRCYLQGLGLPTPRFWEWDCSADLLPELFKGGCE